MGAASWGGRDAAALTRNGYKRNAVAHRCVRMIAEAAASVPLVSPDARVQAPLKSPAPDTAGAGFLKTVYTQLQLSGNAFIEGVRFKDEGPLDALYPLTMRAVRPLMDVRGCV